jgi:hypothetical protein
LERLMMSLLTNETTRDDAELARVAGSRHRAVFWRGSGGETGQLQQRIAYRQLPELTGYPPTAKGSNGIH